MPKPPASSAASSPAPAAGSSVLPPPPVRRTRHDLYYITLAWVFGAVWAWAVTGAALTQFARGLGTPDWAFGLIAMMPFIGVLAQFPAGWFVDHYGHRKPFWYWSATIHRALWLVIALIPWVLPPRRWGNLGWMVMLALLALNWLIANLGGPPWVSWMADVVPRKIRGRYFAFRARMGQFMGLLTTVAAGWIMDKATGMEQAHTGVMLQVTSAILGVAGIMGILDIQSFRSVRDDYPRPASSTGSLWTMLRGPLSDENFRRFLAYNFTLNLGLGFFIQYLLLYAVKELQMSNLRAQVMAIGLPLVAQMLSYPLWGRLVDRLGRKPVIMIGCAVNAFIPLAWILLGKDAARPVDWQAPWGQRLLEMAGANWAWNSQLALVLMFFTATAWSGVELANFNVVMDLAGKNNPHGRGGPGYVAVNALTVALGGIFSGLMASVLTGWIEGLRMPLAIGGGIVITYHGVLFALSAGLRLSAILFLVRLHEPKAAGTRQALSYLGETLASNTRQMLVVPTSLAERAYRWTYLVVLPAGKRIRFGGLPARRWWRRNRP